MRAALLSSPARPDADEDAAGVLGEVAVLLDGAGLPERFRAGCSHTVSWYSHSLAARLLRLGQDPGIDLRGVLAAGIAEVRDQHAADCDLAAGSPSATVVMVRRRGALLEHLVLCDSSLLLVDRDGDVRRITDGRVDRVVGEERTAEAVEARRNVPGGFWVARHEPEAAAEALVGERPIAGLRTAHLVSDGVTRLIDLLGAQDAVSLAGALESDPGAVLTDLRARERAVPTAERPRKTHDDATVLSVSWPPPLV